MQCVTHNLIVVSSNKDTTFDLHCLQMCTKNSGSLGKRKVLISEEYRDGLVHRLRGGNNFLSTEGTDVETDMEVACSVFQLVIFYH